MGKKHQEGFTLIELLVLMMVLAVVVGLGVPALGDIVANSRMSAAGERSGEQPAGCARRGLDPQPHRHGLRQQRLGCANTRAAMPASSLLDGWIVFEDANNDGVVDAAEPVLQAHGPLDDSIRSAERIGSRRGPPQVRVVSRRRRSSGHRRHAAGVRNIQLCDARGNRRHRRRPCGRALDHDFARRPAGADRPRRATAGRGSNPLGGC